jgi:hypothetical protein
MFAEMSLDNLAVVELRTGLESTASTLGLFGRLNRHAHETI